MRRRRLLFVPALLVVLLPHDDVLWLLRVSVHKGLADHGSLVSVRRRDHGEVRNGRALTRGEAGDEVQKAFHLP